MNTPTLRGVASRAFGTITLLALVSTAGAAQDSFGRRTTTPPPDTSRGRMGAPPVAPPNTVRGNTTPAGAPNAAADKNTMLEREDFGVAPTRTLRNGPMHAPTPTSIPGAQVITTVGLLDLQRRQVPYVLIDVLGAPDMLPNAISGAWLSQPGSFNDQVQSQATQMLMQAAQGRKDTPLVFYCLSPHCWMSYNAALRAVNAGFTNVLWYRGGVEAWRRSGQR
jgi:PQQ-dependent catabolism-associated CXXCW motif protein